MTIRFAAARNRNRIATILPLGRGRVPMPVAANDNGMEAANDDALLTEVLRHFAEHGLCAAQQAGDRAISAHHAGDSEGFDWWLSVCRMLDRRMADAVANQARLAP